MPSSQTEDFAEPVSLLAQVRDQLTLANLFSDFASDLNSAINLFEAVLSACAYFRRIEGFDQVCVLALDADDALCGLRDSLEAPGSVESFDVGEARERLTKLLQTGGELLAPPSDPRSFDVVLGHSLAKAVVAVPAEGRQARAGYLMIASPKDSEIDEHVLTLVRNAVRPLGAAIERIVTYEKSRLQAISDPLTKLFNRRFFIETLDNEIHKSRRVDYPLCLLMIDIDHFKKVNDTYGHLAGDQVLVTTAATLKKSIRDVDLATRYGGEEMAIILVGCDDDGLRIIAERIRATVQAQVEIEAAKPEKRTITISIGAARLQPSVTSVADFVELADKALYAAKEGGRNRVVYSGAPES